MHKTLTPQRLLKDDRFATCGLLTISICWETAAKKNCNNSLEKQLQESILNENQLLQKQNPRQQHQAKAICNYTDGWRRRGPVQVKCLGSTQTKDGTTKGNKEQTGASTLSHDKVSRSLEKKNKAISFPRKMKLYHSLVLSILHYGCVNWTWLSGKARPSL